MSSCGRPRRGRAELSQKRCPSSCPGVLSTLFPSGSSLCPGSCGWLCGVWVVGGHGGGGDWRQRPCDLSSPRGLRTHLVWSMCSGTGRPPEGSRAPLCGPCRAQAACRGRGRAPGVATCSAGTPGNEHQLHGTWDRSAEWSPECHSVGRGARALGSMPQTAVMRAAPTRPGAEHPPSGLALQDRLGLELSGPQTHLQVPSAPRCAWHPV